MLFNIFKHLKPIFISVSPNTQKDDVFSALKLIFQPWLWKRGQNINLLEKKFREYLGVKYSISFVGARTGFLAILNSLNLEKGDEVLIQAFTCNALVNPILWSNLKPVFVDIEKDTLNIDVKDLEKKIGVKSKVVVVQHTFGLPANLLEILHICKKYNLILIEDCAHSLGAVFEEKKIGTFGKIAFFSLGKDKIISSVFGGIVLTNDNELGKKIREFQEKLECPSYFWIFQQLLYIILINILIKPAFVFGKIGALFLFFLQKLKILSKATSQKEKRGEIDFYILKKMPNVLSVLALLQFKKLEKFIEHQKQIAKIYDENLKNLNFSLPKNQKGRIYMRYSILLENKDTDEILKIATKRKIFLDDGWRKTPITPPDTNQEKMNYVFGSCKTAENVTKTILNLPTHINISQIDAKKIVDFLKMINL